MKLPTQAESIVRSDRVSAAQNSGVAPQFWGSVIGTLAPVLVDALSGILRK